MSHLRLANGREILVQQADIELEIAGNELFARYIGLHNRPFERRYPLFSTLLDVESDARLVGDGFQMLSQASGTLSHIQEVGRCQITISVTASIRMMRQSVFTIP